jgi:hypothetical protein
MTLFEPPPDERILELRDQIRELPTDDVMMLQLLAVVRLARDLDMTPRSVCEAAFAQSPSDEAWAARGHATKHEREI